jgi:hypothetical protein
MACLATARAYPGGADGDLHFFSVQDPARPVYIGCLGCDDSSNYTVRGFDAAGQRGVVAQGGRFGSYVQALDLSVAGAPQGVGLNSDWASNCWDIFLKDAHVILAWSSYMETPVSEVRVLKLTELPAFTAAPVVAGGQVTLTVNQVSGVKLERATRLDHPDWTEVPGSGAGQTNRIILPVSVGAEYFRLVAPCSARFS